MKRMRMTWLGKWRIRAALAGAIREMYCQPRPDVERLERRVLLSATPLYIHTTTNAGATLGVGGGAAGQDAIYFDAGLQAASVYDAATGVWTQQPFAAAQGGYAQTTVDSDVIFAGGVTLSDMEVSDAVNIFDAATGDWSTATLSQPRYGAAAISVDDDALIAGGHISTSMVPGVSNVVDIFDAATNSWSTATLSQGRASAAAATVGNLALFAGGEQAGLPGATSAAVDIFDASTNTWSTATLSQARDYITAATIDGKVIFAGGSSILGTASSNAVDIYDSATNTWSTAELSRAREDMSVAVVGDEVIFAGGQLYSSSVFNPSDAVDIYNAATNTWSIATLSQARSGMSVSVVGDQVIFAGGIAGEDAELDGIPSAAVDIYNTDANTWSTATLSQPRGTIAASVVGSSVFFAGGNQTTGAISQTVDVYDTATDSWSVVALANARSQPLAMTMGSTAIIGADGSATANRNIVDLFTPATVAGNTYRGARGTLNVRVQYTGGVSLPASYSVQVYACANTTGRGAVLFGSATVGASVASGSTATVAVPISLRARLASGSYDLLVVLTPLIGHGTIFITNPAALVIAAPSAARAAAQRALLENLSADPLFATGSPIAADFLRKTEQDLF